MTLAYDRFGSGSPLVLLHPLGADRHVWRPVRPLLEPHREVIAVDLPGFGDSPPLEHEDVPDPRALAARVCGFLRALGVGDGRARIAGNSLGGWVALEVALAGHAADVTAIAPAGLWTAPLGPRPELARSAARAARPLLTAAMRVGPLRRLALRGSVAHPDRVPPADAARLVRAYAAAPGFAAVNRAMRAGTFTRLADVPVPVTLVWPERDRLVARARQVPARVRQIALPGCGHVPMWDDPRAVAEVLLG